MPGIEIRSDRRKAIRVEIVSDSKDAVVQINGIGGKRTGNCQRQQGSLVEINRARREGAAIEVNGHRARAHWRFGGRYLFGQEQAQVEDPPLPPSQFNPDPGGGNLLEPEPPPDLFPPILPQPPEYGEESVPRSLGLPRRGVRESDAGTAQTRLRSLPGFGNRRGLLPARSRCRIAGSSDSDAGNVTPTHQRKRLINPARCASGIRICRASSKATRPIIGQDIFLNLTLNDFFQFEARTLADAERSEHRAAE